MDYVSYFRKDIKIKVCIPEEIILETSHNTQKP